MKNKIVVVLIFLTGLLASQARSEQTHVPDGEWSGDITSQCTVNNTDSDLGFRSPHIDVQCSSGRCFAQLSFEVYEKDTSGLQDILIPGWEETGNRLTVIGWGPIVSRHIENGSVQGNANQEPEDTEAYLDGLTVVFLPSDDLSISIDHARLNCNGILLPKL
ncbi:MAG: hypothetical protein OXF20_08835 [Gammaproteobacteria bacterium]|nr:hypothetical protein [Gammaproteobacteria bacterium]